MAGFNPLATQGNLNRIITQVVVAQYGQLNVNAGYMSKGQAILTLEGPFVEQIGTATGLVNSPMPYVFGQVVINLMRSQALANAWILQAQVNSYLGPVEVWPDSTAFAPITLTNASITAFDPGAFDGQDPTVRVTVRGTYYVNNSLWSSLTGVNFG
jgi:hypothetical protein